MTTVVTGHTLGTEQTRGGTTVAHINHLEAVKVEQSDGNGTPAGPVFNMGKSEKAGDERDAEFERY